MKDRIQQVIVGVFESHEGRDVSPKRIQDYINAMQNPTPTKPIVPDRLPECQKKHIKKSGKR